MSESTASSLAAGLPTAQYSGKANVPMRDVMRHWWSFDQERPGKAWQYWLATFAYNCLFGTGLTLFFYGFNPRAQLFNTWMETVWISNCIGLSIHSLFELFFRLTLPGFVRWPKLLRHASAALIALIGIALGYTVAFGVFGRNFWNLVLGNPRFAFGMLFLGLLGCLVWVLLMDGQTRRLRAETEILKQREAEAALKRQASEAELRALQAQIEPHFLFNTLANVQALIDYEPDKAKRMLEAFIEYLRNTLDASRHTNATLGDELELLRRYLQVMQVRMGERLSFALDVPPELHKLPFAPLLLQPLVENAIKYGLEPKIEGGEVRISAQHLGAGRVQVSVQDNGIGTEASAKRQGPKSKTSGTGMSNVRSRLQTLFGENATLNIASNPMNTATVIEFDIKNPF